jgi:hypothetical protein
MIVRRNGSPPLAGDDAGGRKYVIDFNIEIQMKRYSELSHRGEHFLDTLQEELFGFSIPMVGAIELDLLLFGCRVGKYVNAAPGRHEMAKPDR